MWHANVTKSKPQNSSITNSTHSQDKTNQHKKASEKKGSSSLQHNSRKNFIQLNGFSGFFIVIYCTTNFFSLFLPFTLSKHHRIRRVVINQNQRTLLHLSIFILFKVSLIVIEWKFNQKLKLMCKTRNIYQLLF